MAMVLRAVAALVLGLLAQQSRAQGVPQYVKGPLSGFEYECAEQKQRFDAKAFVSTLDLDGDGKPDHVFDIAKGCAASKLLYCNQAEGCLIDVFLSSQELKMAGIKVRAFRPGKVDGKTALLLSLSGPECGKSASLCERALVWNGTDLVLK